jgi:hypothetical protein
MGTANPTDPADVRRHDFIDFPLAWALQRDIGNSSPPHNKRCSCVAGWHAMSGPGFLCDCGAIQKEWRKRRRALGLPVERTRP